MSVENGLRVGAQHLRFDVVYVGGPLERERGPREREAAAATLDALREALAEADAETMSRVAHALGEPAHVSIDDRLPASNLLFALASLLRGGPER